MSRPVVSIVMPVFDAAEFLDRSVQSVLDQTLSDWELLLVDDASQDESLALCRQFALGDPRISIIELTKNMGAAAARNAGIERACGRYIAFLDSDDRWKPEKLARQVGYMQRHDVTFSYGDYEERDRYDDTLLKTHTLPPRLSHADLLNCCPIGCLTAVYDQQALGKVYMPQVARGQDWGLWLALTRDGTIAHKYPGVEAVYYRGGGSLSANKLRKSLDMYQIYREQEGLGRIRSMWHLSRHALSSLRK